jgi:large subunit ribosomal protein L25
MAISFELNAEARTDTGKGASRRLRHAGKVPAIMYGGGKDPESLTLSHNEVQRNLEHEAFYSHILLKTHAPVHILGEDNSPGVKAGGLVSHDLTEVSIECLPKNLPEYLEIDISEMEIGDAKHLSDLQVPEGVTLSDLVRENDLTVVSIHAKRAEVEEEETPTAEGAAEGGEETKDAGEGDGEGESS